MSSVPTREMRREQTRAGLITAADRLFTAQGFHATSLDAIAEEAGVTKGAVYSNFTGKEDLFFAVYEARVAAAVAEGEKQLAAHRSFGDVFEALVSAAARRRGSDADAWLSVFFEFWAHVLRRREHLERFAELHARVIAPGIALLDRQVAEEGLELPESPRVLVTGWYAMQLGLSLERLTQPEVVDGGLGARMARRQWQEIERSGGRR